MTFYDHHKCQNDDFMAKNYRGLQSCLSSGAALILLRAQVTKTHYDNNLTYIRKGALPEGGSRSSSG